MVLALGLGVRKLAVGLIVAHRAHPGDLSSEVNRNFAVHSLRLAGGLLLLAAFGVGKYNVDEWRRLRTEKRFAH